MHAPEPAGRAAPAGARPAPRHPAAALSRALSRLADRVVLFRVGELVFVTFGLFSALGAALGLAWAGALLVGQGVPPLAFVGLALGGGAVIVVGSWLLAQLYDFRLLLQSPRAALRRPVFVSWGGLLPVVLLMGAYGVWSGLGALLLWDALGRSVNLGHALGRLGCITYGCCFGTPTGARLAITYRHPLSKVVRSAGLGGVPLHAAPFYESVLGLAIFAAANLAGSLGAPLGVPSAIAALGYGLGRFAIEFAKHNEDDRLLVGRWSVNHVASLVLAAVGLAILSHVLLAPLDVPPVRWADALDAAPWLAGAVVPSAVVVFVGFSVHRGRVGDW